jgi:RimJ/RimL family protein N-acetyltransferase
MVHLRTKFHRRQVVIRDVEERDLDTLVSYWHDNDLAYLKSLGVDVSKLAAREVTRSRFLSSLPDAPRPRERATFVVTADDELVAYTNLNFKSLDEAYVHVHTLARNSLAKALAYALFPQMVTIFFASYPITRLLMQTSPENQNINRLLTRFGLTPERVYIEKPDGMARPGEFNVYEIPRTAADQIQRRPQFSNSLDQ